MNKKSEGFSNSIFLFSPLSHSLLRLHYNLISLNHLIPIKIETLFMIPSQEFSFLSSNLVKETARHGGDVSKLVTKNVYKELKKKFS